MPQIFRKRASQLPHHRLKLLLRRPLLIDSFSRSFGSPTFSFHTSDEPSERAAGMQAPFFLMLLELVSSIDIKFISAILAAFNSTTDISRSRLYLFTREAIPYRTPHFRVYVTALPPAQMEAGDGNICHLCNRLALRARAVARPNPTDSAKSSFGSLATTACALCSGADLSEMAPLSVGYIPAAVARADLVAGVCHFTILSSASTGSSVCG